MTKGIGRLTQIFFSLKRSNPSEKVDNERIIIFFIQIKILMTHQIIHTVYIHLIDLYKLHIFHRPPF